MKAYFYFLHYFDDKNESPKADPNQWQTSSINRHQVLISQGSTSIYWFFCLFHCVHEGVYAEPCTAQIYPTQKTTKDYAWQLLNRPYC